MKKKLLKILVVFTFIMFNTSLSAQDVDLSASVDVTPPLSVGQTFIYTIETIPSTSYRGVQVYLNYNSAVIQLNSLTPDNSTLVSTFLNETSVPGIIQYASGAFSNISAGTIIFTAEFEVVSTSGNVLIEHDLLSGGNPNGTAVTNAGGQDRTGITNDIILSTLSVGQAEFSNGISIFPNPVNDLLNIKLNASLTEIDNIKIFSIEGKLIQQYDAINLNNNHIKLDTSVLKQAMYFVTITSTENELATFKLIVN